MSRSKKQHTGFQERLGFLEKLEFLERLEKLEFLGSLEYLASLVLLALLGPLALLSCSQSSEIPESPESPEQAAELAIGFSADLSDAVEASKAPATRAAGDGEFDNVALKASGFGVYCWYTGSADFTTPKPASARSGSAEPYVMLMRNQKVEWKAWNSTTESWNYTPSKYWPLKADEMLTFRAYAPYTNYIVMDDATGMPQLPVVVEATDYHNGTQHDPLWGTGATLITHENDPYLPDDNKYGSLYNNITFEKSGDAPIKDEHDGIIHWFFHHGMAKLMFACSVIQDPGCDKVTITGITISPLNKQGLLDLSSATESSSDKPTWNDCAGDITVALDNSDLADDPLEITTYADKATDYINLLPKGLLIIPRDYRSTAMTVRITYTIDNETEPLTAEGPVKWNFEGNTSYTLRMSLTPSTKGLEITLVQSAFTPWQDYGDGDHTVYNW